jgi:cytosine/adenosine deaminase-related metal-dependent hydrolase
MKSAPVTIYRAAAIRDAQGTEARPGAVAIKNGSVAAAGPVKKIPKRLAEHARIVDRPNDLILPAMVNAHAHLDLTTFGPVEYTGHFGSWLRGVMGSRPTQEPQIQQAVTRGLELSRQGGVGHIGDIAGSVAALRSRCDVPPDLAVAGVSFLECFGLGDQLPPAFEAFAASLADQPFEAPVARHTRGVMLGIGPHAPYSTGRGVYEAASKLSRQRIYRLTTHLAESPQELAFLADATGALAELIDELMPDHPAIKATGQHPIDWFWPHLKHARWLLAHCNYVEDEHIEILQRTGSSVVYCPIASAYFGLPHHGEHRYRDMLDAGVNVCLGTDSILCQNPDADQPLGIMPQMRYLYRRDNTDPQTLLKMATTNGMLAMELSENDATLHKRAPATFAAVPIDPNDPTDPLIQALTNDNPVDPIHATDAAE